MPLRCVSPTHCHWSRWPQNSYGRPISLLSSTCAVAIIQYASESVKSGKPPSTPPGGTISIYSHTIRTYQCPSCVPGFYQRDFLYLIDHCVVTYIDDILIYSSSYDGHVLHVRTVLTRLQQQQLCFKAEKCEFHKNSLIFLRYVISLKRVEMDSGKVRAVMD